MASELPAQHDTLAPDTTTRRPMVLMSQNDNSSALRSTVPTVKLAGQKDDFWDLYGQDDLFIDV